MYGGTKTEMQRLLADAEKLSGVHYNLDNLGDVYSAIHVIQEDLGLTGVAAEEASTTFTGSFGAMKAAATNFLADLTTGGDVSSSLSALITNTGTFLFNNLIPMLRDLISSLPEVISQIVTADGPAFIKQGMGLITELKYGVISALDTLATDLIPNFLDMGINFINSLAEGMSGNVTNMLSEFLPRLLEFTTMLREKAGSFVDAGINLIMNIAQGLIDGLPVMIENIPTIVSNIAGIINDNAPKLLVTAGNLIIALVKGLIQSIPVIIANMPKIVSAIVDVISAFNWINLGSKIMKFFKDGIVSLTSNIGKSMSEIVSDMAKKVTSFDWKNLGKYIIEGILAGLKAAAKALLKFIIDLCASMLSSIKEFFNIGSPSKLMRDEVGKWIPAGIAVGIEANTKSVEDAMNALAADTLTVAKLDFSGSNYDFGDSSQGSGTVINQTLNVTTTDNSPDEIARTIRLESRYGLMVGGALG